MPDYSDALLKQVLQEVKRVAVVGVSMNPIRPSYYVARYLSLKAMMSFRSIQGTRARCCSARR